MATTAAPAGAPAAAPRVRRSSLWWPAVAVTAAAAVVHTLLTRRLSGDLQYVLGALRLGGDAGYSPSEVFTHRPFFYRWFVALLDLPTAGGPAVRETLIGIEGAVVAAVTALALYAALLRRVTAREAAVTAGATGLALVLAPRTDFLQPEWTAVLLAVLGVAAALGVRRPWPAALLAALPLGLAVTMKYSTASTAVFAVLLIRLADRGRALRTALAAVPAAAALFGLSVLLGSHEWQWTEDMPRINQSALGRTGLRPGGVLAHSVSFLADRALLSPVLLLLPGALLLLLARCPGRARRVELLAVAALVGAGSLAVVIVQGNWFPYHAVQSTVAAAAAWGLAVGGTTGPPPWRFGAVSLAYGALPVLYPHAPGGLHRPATVWALGLLGLLAAAADVHCRRAARRPAPVRSAAPVVLAGVVCLAGPVWPGSPHLVRHGEVGATNAAFLRDTAHEEAEAARLRARIPAGAPVLYLAFGDTAYYVDRPARCRYPIATFLQRSRFLPDVAGLPSFAENADCVDHDPAPYAILDRAWFRLAFVDPGLRARVQATYACPPPSKDTPTVVCTRR
ncbi:hypothetical protein [Streptomyces antibioticus]|uniref:hypothetical protein n=1 Tax=Streptomyces antibioticus TaxID=1890 RepID=UPI0033E63736